MHRQPIYILGFKSTNFVLQTVLPQQFFQIFHNQKLLNLGGTWTGLKVSACDDFGFNLIENIIFKIIWLKKEHNIQSV